MGDRCQWCETAPIYIKYHDTEWGVPEKNSIQLWEKLALDGFQAGLSWLTILKKREFFRTAFDYFEPTKVSKYGEHEIYNLLSNKNIVRHRGKIEATINNAKVYMEIEADEGFSEYLWKYVDYRPLQTNRLQIYDIPTFTPLSQEISKDLMHKGFRYCGPTIVYAFMQAVGMVNDHIVSCARHKQLQLDYII